MSDLDPGHWRIRQVLRHHLWLDRVVQGIRMSTYSLTQWIAVTWDRETIITDKGPSPNRGRNRP